MSLHPLSRPTSLSEANEFLFTASVEFWSQEEDSSFCGTVSGETSEGQPHCRTIDSCHYSEAGISIVDHKRFKQIEVTSNIRDNSEVNVVALKDATIRQNGHPGNRCFDKVDEIADIAARILVELAVQQNCRFPIVLSPCALSEGCNTPGVARCQD
jgi:hypothetical protein